MKTSVGESKSKIVKDSIGQGSGGASLVSSLNLGCAIEDTFENNPSTTIGNLNLNALCFQDDISKMNDNLEDARKGCKSIDRRLSKKLLSINYDKSKYLNIGGVAYRRQTLAKNSQNSNENG